MRSVLSFLFAFCLIEDPSRRIFGQKLFLSQSKNSDLVSGKFHFFCLLCKAGVGNGSGPVLEFWGTGVEVSCCRGFWDLLQGCILGVSWTGVWNVLGLGGGFAGVFCFRRERVVFGTRDGNGILDAAGRVVGWVVHGTFLMNVDLVPQMVECLHTGSAEGAGGRELDLGGEKEVGDCLSVNHPCEGCVALGGPVDGQGDGSIGWVDPDGLELFFFQSWVGYSKVVDGEPGRGV